jgi:hypothetical protein
MWARPRHVPSASNYEGACVTGWWLVTNPVTPCGAPQGLLLHSCGCLRVSCCGTEGLAGRTSCLDGESGAICMCMCLLPLLPAFRTFSTGA